MEHQKNNTKKFRGSFKRNHNNRGPRYNDSSRKQGGDVAKQMPRQYKCNLFEVDVGITEFITPGPGFTGVLKSRFSDFHVNEINVNGDVLHLNDLTVPEAKYDCLSKDEANSLREDLKDVISLEMWSKIDNLAGEKADAQENQSIQIEVDNVDKEKRTQIHKVIKTLYSGKLVSTTTNVDEKKLLKILKPKEGRNYSRNSWTFPGEYVNFLVYKENMDTSEVASHIGDRMNLRPSQVNYCGIKDKRGKTTQTFCVRHRTPLQIARSVKNLHNVHIGNFSFSNEVLKLGYLKGNRFRIALRHINGDREHIERALHAVRDKGFINYFGLQRFGNSASVPTYVIGAALLKCDYKLACELILKPRENDAPFMRSIRETWWNDRNSAAAAAKIHNDKFIEKKLLNGLAQHGENDYASALRKIPRNILMLYPHAFQSLLFNRIASRRIKEFGLQLIPGDLVYKNKDESDVDMEEITTEHNNEEINESVESIKNSDIEKDKESASVKTSESLFKFKVKPLTAEDISSGNYSLFDVVLPLPGFDVTYPENVVGKWYETLLQEYGVSPANLQHKIKVFAMPGTYRKLLIRPADMSWKFCQYDNGELPLIPSDWEILKNTISNIRNEAMEGKFTALVLEFNLPSCVYATMMLRELMKTDTSPVNQTQVENNEMKKFTERNEDTIKSHVKVTTQAEKRKAEKDDQEETVSLPEKRRAGSEEREAHILKDNIGETMVCIE